MDYTSRSTLRYTFRSLAVFVLLSVLVVSSAAKGTELKFRAMVKQIVQTTPTEATVTVELFGIEIPIPVNSDTEIEMDGNDEGLVSVSVGDFIKIDGFFSELGIVAEEIEILDGQVEQFRLRGLISELGMSGADITVTLLGVEILVDDLTVIQRRGRGHNAAATVADLSLGTLVDARGRFVDGLRRTDRVAIGSRLVESGQIEFEGRVTAVDGDLVFVDTEGGGTAVVQIHEGTDIKDTVVVGVFVEVEGGLDERLFVLADEIKVDHDGNRDAHRDDDRHGDRDDDRDDDRDGDHDGDRDTDEPIEEGVAIFLDAVGAEAGLEGKADIRFRQEDGAAQQKLEVEIEDALAGTSYGIRVEFPSGTFDFGTITTDESGRAEVEFETSPDHDERDLDAVIPAGLDVRDVIRVQITLDGTVVLEGRLP